MTVIHLTDAQHDTFTASGIIVIDGEWLRWTLQGQPQEQWVAPEGWRILTEPCDTCGGTGKVFSRMIDLGLGDGLEEVKTPCSNCAGGHRVVTLTATSDTSCRRDGTVTLGRFTIPALLPVVEYFTSEPAARVNTVGQLVYLASGTPSSNGAMRIDWSGAPLPHVGQYVAQPEPVTVNVP